MSVPSLLFLKVSPEPSINAVERVKDFLDSKEHLVRSRSTSLLLTANNNYRLLGTCWAGHSPSVTPANAHTSPLMYTPDSPPSGVGWNFLGNGARLASRAS